MFKRTKISLLVSVVAILASGCANQIFQPSGPVEYADIEELRSAFVEAGGTCAVWDQNDNVTAAISSGDCGSDTVLMLFASESEAIERANDIKETSDSWGLDAHLLVGPNWVINSPDAELVESSMFGDLITN